TDHTLHRRRSLFRKSLVLRVWTSANYCRILAIGPVTRVRVYGIRDGDDSGGRGARSAKEFATRVADRDSRGCDSIHHDSGRVCWHVAGTGAVAETAGGCGFAVSWPSRWGNHFGGRNHFDHGKLEYSFV